MATLSICIYSNLTQTSDNTKQDISRQIYQHYKLTELQAMQAATGCISSCPLTDYSTL